MKSYDMGFISHPKEGVLRIFIALKNPSPWPGSNPRTLGPMASTLTTTPPRRPLRGVTNTAHEKSSISMSFCHQIVLYQLMHQHWCFFFIFEFTKNKTALFNRYALLGNYLSPVKEIVPVMKLGIQSEQREQ
jgi:hypothetical protein